MIYRFLFVLRFAIFILIVTGLTGCSGMASSHLRDKYNQDYKSRNDESEKLWKENKGWLLSKLPKANPLVLDILSVLNENADYKYSCTGRDDANCDKLLNLLIQKVGPYRLVRLPDELGQFALLDGDAAYVFRMTDWTFAGVANLNSALYFTVPDVPLRRTDQRSFAFVADNKTDTETVWTIYRRKILDKGQNAKPLSEYTLTRAELDAAGVPKQIDQLTPQQRQELELARQGMTWRRRAQMKAITTCGSSKPRSQKQDGRGGRSKHNRTMSPESTTTDSTTDTASTMEEALHGKAHLNCKAGSGSVITEDGIAAEVYKLIKNKEGSDAIISATAKEIPGGVIRYKYPVGRESIDILNHYAGKGMILQIETIDGSNKLDLNLDTETGVNTGTLALAGNWNLGSGYRIQDKDISSKELATLFIRTYRDCALKNNQGLCKNIPDLFMSFQNPLIAEEFVRYISDHYLNEGTKIQLEQKRKIER